MQAEKQYLQTDGESILPPLANQIAPYIDQAAEARAKKAIKKVEHEALQVKAKDKKLHPSAPENENSSKSPRMSQFYEEEDANSMNSGSVKSGARRYVQPPQDSSPQGSVEREETSPSTKFRSNSTRSNHRPRPSTVTNSSPTGTTKKSSGEKFGAAVENIAAMKMHEYIVNRKGKKAQKHKLWEEIKGYKQMNSADVETEVFDRHKYLVAAWKIRFYVEYYRSKLYKAHAITKYKKYAAEIVTVRDLNAQLARALSVETGDGGTIAQKYKREIDDILRSTQVTSNEITEHSQRIDELKEERVAALKVADAAKTELELTKASFTSMFNAKSSELATANEQNVAHEKRISELEDEIARLNKLRDEGFTPNATVAEMERATAAAKEEHFQNTHVPEDIGQDFPVFEQLQSYKEVVAGREFAGRLGPDDALTIAEQLTIVCRDYNIAVRELHELAAHSDSSAAYNIGLQRLVSELAHKQKVSEEEIEAHLAAQTKLKEAISALEIRMADLRKSNIHISEERDLMGETIELNMDHTERRCEQYELDLMGAEDKLSTVFNQQVALFMGALRRGARIVITERNPNASMRGTAPGGVSRNPSGFRRPPAAGGGSTNALPTFAANQPSEFAATDNSMVSIGGWNDDGHGQMMMPMDEQSTTFMGGATNNTYFGDGIGQIVQRTEVEDRLLNLVGQLNSKLGQFEALADPQRIANERRKKYFEDQIAERGSDAARVHQEFDQRIAREKLYWQGQFEHLQEQRADCDRKLATNKRRIVDIKGELRYIHRQKNHLKSVLRSWHDDFVLSNQKEPTEEEQTTHTAYLMVAYEKAQTDLQEKLRSAMVVTLEATDLKTEYDTLTQKLLKAHRRAENGCSPECSRPGTPSMWHEDEKQPFTTAVALDGPELGLPEQFGSSLRKDEAYLNSAFEEMRMSPVDLKDRNDPPRPKEEPSTLSVAIDGKKQRLHVKKREEKHQSQLGAIQERISELKIELSAAGNEFNDCTTQLTDQLLVRSSTRDALEEWLKTFFFSHGARNPTLREKRMDKTGSTLYPVFNNSQAKMKSTYTEVQLAYDKLVTSRTHLVDALTELSLCQKRLNSPKAKRSGKKPRAAAMEELDRETLVIEDEVFSDEVNAAMSCELPLEPEYFDPYSFEYTPPQSRQKPIESAPTAVLEDGSEEGSDDDRAKSKAKKKILKTHVVKKKHKAAPADSDDDSDGEGDPKVTHVVNTDVYGDSVSDVVVDGSMDLLDGPSCVTFLDNSQVHEYSGDGGSLVLPAHGSLMSVGTMGTAVTMPMSAVMAADQRDTAHWTGKEWKSHIQNVSKAVVATSVFHVLDHFQQKGMIWSSLDDKRQLEVHNEHVRQGTATEQVQGHLGTGFEQQVKVARREMEQALKNARGEAGNSGGGIDVDSVDGNDGNTTNISKHGIFGPEQTPQRGQGRGGAPRDTYDDEEDDVMKIGEGGFDNNYDEYVGGGTTDDALADILGSVAGGFDEPENHQAATRVQAVFRGKNTRKKSIEEKQLRETQEAATKVQAVIRGSSARRASAQREKEAAEARAAREKFLESLGDPDCELAATKMQSRFRGFLQRKTEAEVERTRQREVAACIIQRMVRGAQGRVSSGQMRARGVLIQLLYAGQVALENDIANANIELDGMRHSLDSSKMKFYEYDGEKETLKKQISSFVDNFKKTSNREPTLAEKKSAIGHAYDDLWRVQDSLKRLEAEIKASEKDIFYKEQVKDELIVRVHQVQGDIRHYQAGGDLIVREEPSAAPGGSSVAMDASADVDEMESHYSLQAQNRAAQQAEEEAKAEAAAAMAAAAKAEEEAIPKNAETLLKTKNQIQLEIDAQMHEINILEGYVKVAKSEVKDAKRKKIPLKEKIRQWMENFEAEYHRPPRNIDKTATAEAEHLFGSYERANVRVNQALEHQAQTESVLANTVALLEKKKKRMDALSNLPSTAVSAATVTNTHNIRHKQEKEDSLRPAALR